MVGGHHDRFYSLKMTGRQNGVGDSLSRMESGHARCGDSYHKQARCDDLAVPSVGQAVYGGNRHKRF